MAKRPKTKATKPVGQPKLLSPKVNSIHRHLEFTYALGTEALAQTKQHQTSPNGKPNSKSPNPTRTRYGSGVITGLVEKHGVHLNTVETARRIAKRYPPNYFRKVTRLRTKKGLPLTTNHFAHLSFVEDPKQRARFERRTIKFNWSVRKLAAAIKEDQIKHGHTKATVGKKPVISKTLPGVVRQIIDYCDKWRRWSGTFSAEIENRDALRPKLKHISRELALLDRRVKAIHEMAGALVAPKEMKGPSRGTKTSRNGRPKAKPRATGKTPTSKRRKALANR